MYTPAAAQCPAVASCVTTACQSLADGAPASSYASATLDECASMFRPSCGNLSAAVKDYVVCVNTAVVQRRCDLVANGSAFASFRDTLLQTSIVDYNRSTWQVACLSLVCLSLQSAMQTWATCDAEIGGTNATLVCAWFDAVRVSLEGGRLTRAGPIWVPAIVAGVVLVVVAIRGILSILQKRRALSAADDNYHRMDDAAAKRDNWMRMMTVSPTALVH